MFAFIYSHNKQYSNVYTIEHCFILWYFLFSFCFIPYLSNYIIIHFSNIVPPPPYIVSLSFFIIFLFLFIIVLDFSKLPIQIKSTSKFNVGLACNHKHGRAKSATHDAEEERLARERQKEINVLSLLIMARRKALESYKLREETLYPFIEFAWNICRRFHFHAVKPMI